MEAYMCAVPAGRSSHLLKAFANSLQIQQMQQTKYMTFCTDIRLVNPRLTQHCIVLNCPVPMHWWGVQMCHEALI